MTLEPIGDIGVASLSENVPTSNLVWDSASDWDNAAGEAAVVHESFGDLPGSGTIQLGYPSFDRGGSSLHAYWPLDEDSGSTANDVAGSNRDGTAENDPILGQGGTGGTTAWEFVGDSSSGDDVQVNEGDLNYATPPFSFAYWVKTTQKANQHGMDNRDNNSRKATCYREADGSSGYLEPEFSGTNNGVFVNTNFNHADGNWHRVVCVIDSTTSDPCKVYIDGTLEGSSGTDPGDMAAGNLHFASRGGNDSYFDGRFDDVRIWNRALTSAQVSEDYNSRKSGHLETATKSFGSNQQPDLANLSYSLNGQSISLKVIGSPGTASEEVITQSLDGSTSYTLSWSNGHTDFRLRPEFTSGDVTVSPTFSGGELAP